MDFWAVRRRLNIRARAMRKRALAALPGIPAESVATVVAQGPQTSRWAPFPDLARKYGPDRPDRDLSVRKFEGEIAVDPKTGHLLKGGRILWGSTDGVGPEREPSLSHWFRPAGEFEEELVVLRGAFDRNYYHFIADTFPKVLVSEEHVPARVPFLVSRTLASQPFFRGAVELGAFGSRRILVQDSRRVRCRVAWVIRSAEPDTRMLHAISDRIRRNVPVRQDIPGLYVRRPSNAPNGRHLRNDDELCQVLGGLGFTIFDPQSAPLAEQIAVFRAARIVVAAHGAGLTNLLWRAGHPCRVLELHIPTQVTRDYAFICAALGFEHQFIPNLNPVGSPFRAASDADVSAILKSLQNTPGVERRSA